MTRPLVTMLYVPAGDERKLAKMPTLQADALILDLEDAVAVARKPTARLAAADAIESYRGNARLFVRINAINSPFAYEDLVAVVRPGLAGIVLPKASSAGDVHLLAWLLAALESLKGMDAGAVQIEPILETPTGVLQALAIASAHPRVRRLCFGAGDFSLETGLTWPPTHEQSPTVLAAKAAIVMASSSAGIEPPHDSVYPDFKDMHRLELEAREAKALGFGGKHAIHPAQVSAIARAFAPTETEITWATKVTEAFAAAEERGVANVAVDGKLVDYPVFERARRVMAAADVPSDEARDA